MKIVNLFLVGALTFSIASCGNGNKQAKELDACGCAAITDQGSQDYKKCKELRADAQFEADYQKCKIAIASGIQDTSKISLNKGNEGKALKQVEDGSFIIDPATSTIGWIGEKVSGEKNNGSIPVKSGSFILENGVLKSGEVIFDMSGITVDNLAGASQSQLEKHLKSDEFFDVAKYKEAKYVIKSATVSDNIKYDIIGDLTIKGVTKELNTKLIIAPNGKNASVAGAISFDRTAFGVNFGSAKISPELGSEAVKDDIILKVLLKAKKSE